MEDIDKKFSKVSQAQENDINFENKNTECRTNLETVESETVATNEQTVPTCGLHSGDKLDHSCNVDKTVGGDNSDEENMSSSENSSTETNQQSLSNVDSDTLNSDSNDSSNIKSENIPESSLLEDSCNTATYQSVCTEHRNGSPETSTTTHKNLRKRNASNSETSKHTTKSEKEFVIHHEHCEKLDSVSTNEDIVRATSQLPENNKYHLHELKNELSQKAVDLPVHLVKDITENSTRGLHTCERDFSLLHYLNVEVTRGYLFEEQEEKYQDQLKKVYTFMKTPRELEKLMWFGFLLCVDCFLFVFTYLPMRVLLAVLRILENVICLKFLRNRQPFLEPHQVCDLLRGLILLVCCAVMNCLDLSILYHIVRGQSVIKLYVIYNMLDIADRLFSSIGQDTLDALFWTAAEPGHRIIMIILHFGLACVYVFFHAVLVLFQAITLNVAINSHNKVLMVVMISNQFVELKGCVFKKFEKNNLFQMSCADIRERFYYVILVSLVTLRNMHELQWNLDHLYELMPSVAMLLCSEVFVDWVKHAFITKFNCISSEVYHEYRELLALDAATSRLFGQQARSDHFDLVSRRLGFIPLPLACVVYRVTSQSVKISGTAGIIVLILVYLWLTSVKILNSIILLGLSSHYVMNKTSNSENKPNENSPSLSDLQLPVADPLDRDQSKVPKVSKPRQVKALNEIDRYTLCSNRIV